MAKLIEKRAQPEPPPVIGYTLELDMEEAALLREIFAYVTTPATPMGRAARRLWDALDTYIPRSRGTISIELDHISIVR